MDPIALLVVYGIEQGEEMESVNSDALMPDRYPASGNTTEKGSDF